MTQKCEIEIPEEIQNAELDGVRVVVAMSGGVDSSVVAALLADQGAQAIGVSMRLYKTGDDGPAKGCCSPDDLYDARSVASSLGMPFYVVNYEDDFESRVIEHFVAEYKQGRTPSPCVLCNDHLKFDTLLGLTDSVGAVSLATGHYARIEQDETGRYRMLRGVDRKKDQSYFLFGMKREVLPRISFPLGGLEKHEVRALAERFGLPTAQKAESQDLCFVGGGHYLDFLEKRLSQEDKIPGQFVHVETEEVLGEHDGIHQYTVGQRRGLRIGGTAEPLYVVGICPDTGRVSVGEKPALLSNECIIARCNWLAFESLDAPVEAEVQVRYRHKGVPALVEPLGDGRARIVFDKPEAAISPGQAAVVYRDDEVLGGGWIESPK